MRKIKSPLDLIGIIASLLCAIHCMALPLLMTISALGSFTYFSNPKLEWLIIGLSILIASSSLLWSFLRIHHRPQAIWIAILGISLIIGSHIGHGVHDYWLAAIGGVLLATAHAVNWRFLSKPSQFSVSLQNLWTLSFVVIALLTYKFTQQEEAIPKDREDFLELVWKKE